MADKPKLTRAERKQIEAVIRKYRGDGKPHTAQDTIPYQIMYPDGICYLGNRRYSQSIEFFDINYLLAQPDDQTAIFEYLCDLYAGLCAPRRRLVSAQRHNLGKGKSYAGKYQRPLHPQP